MLVTGVFGLALDRLLLLRLLLEELLGLRAHLLVLLEGFYQSAVLLVVEFETQLLFYLSQFTSLLKEFNCRLKSYVQFA